MKANIFPLYYPCAFQVSLILRVTVGSQAPHILAQRLYSDRLSYCSFHRFEAALSSFLTDLLAIAATEKCRRFFSTFDFVWG